jgi:hypothetical protein
MLLHNRRGDLSSVGRIAVGKVGFAVSANGEKWVTSEIVEGDLRSLKGLLLSESLASIKVGINAGVRLVQHV